jgi:hypothetical protein
MATNIGEIKDLRFEIDPRPDESQRACTAIAQAVLPPSRGNALMIGLYAAVGLAAYLLTPSTRPITFLSDSLPSRLRLTRCRPKAVVVCAPSERKTRTRLRRITSSLLRMESTPGVLTSTRGTRGAISPRLAKIRSSISSRAPPAAARPCPSDC